MTVDIRDAHGEIQTVPTIDELIAALNGELTFIPAALSRATATVANGASLSDAVDCTGGKPVLIEFPSSLNNLTTLTGISISFDGIDYGPLLNADGTTFTAIALTGTGRLPLSLLNTGGINYLKLQFGQNANASTAFKLILQR